MAKSKGPVIIRKAGPFTVRSSGGHLDVQGTGVSFQYGHTYGGRDDRVVIPTDPGVLRQLADALTSIADEQQAKGMPKPKPKGKPAEPTEPADPS
jgi:hypothetical protein